MIFEAFHKQLIRTNRKVTHLSWYIGFLGYHTCIYTLYVGIRSQFKVKMASAPLMPMVTNSIGVLLLITHTKLTLVNGNRAKYQIILVC